MAKVASPNSGTEHRNTNRGLLPNDYETLLKTIGDAYMAVAGVPTANRQHPIDTCLAALEINAVTARMKAQREKRQT